MMNIKELDKTISYLQELKKEQKGKSLEVGADIIKKDLLKELEKTLLNFGSDKFVNFMAENNLECCFSFNFEDIMRRLEETIEVDVWHCD